MHMMRTGAVSARDVVVAFVVLAAGLVFLRIGMSAYAFMHAYSALVEQQSVVEEAYKSLVQEHIAGVPDNARMFSDVSGNVAAITPGSLIERERQLVLVQITLGRHLASSAQWGPEVHANEHVSAILKEAGGRGKISELLAEYNRRLSSLQLASTSAVGSVFASMYDTEILHFLFPDGKPRGTTVFM